jgi:molybdopterin synthase sulfur carrier subunit
MAAAANDRTVTLKYFAWVREKAGRSEERVALPAHVRSVADLKRWQMGRGHPFDLAFERANVIRVAIDKVHVKDDASLAGATEIAFFPPVTGG